MSIVFGFAIKVAAVWRHKERIYPCWNPGEVSHDKDKLGSINRWEKNVTRTKSHRSKDGKNRWWMLPCIMEGFMEPDCAFPVDEKIAKAQACFARFSGIMIVTRPVCGRPWRQSWLRAQVAVSPVACIVDDCVINDIKSSPLGGKNGMLRDRPIGVKEEFCYKNSPLWERKVKGKVLARLGRGTLMLRA